MFRIILIALIFLTLSAILYFVFKHKNFKELFKGNNFKNNFSSQPFPKIPDWIKTFIPPGYDPQKYWDAYYLAEYNDDVCIIPEFSYSCKYDPVEGIKRPVNISNNFTPDVVRYATDLILRVATIDNTPEHSPIIPPSNLLLDHIFSGIMGSTPAAVFKSEDSSQIWFIARGGGPEKSLDFKGQQISHPCAGEKELPADLKVHEGFWTMYEGIRDEWKEYLQNLSNLTKEIICCGHSSGSAYATLASIEAALKTKNINVHCYALSPPKVLNYDLSPLMNSFFRVVNNYDTVVSASLAVLPNAEIPDQPHYYVDQGVGCTFSCNRLSWKHNHSLRNIIENLDFITVQNKFKPDTKNNLCFGILGGPKYPKKVIGIEKPGYNDDVIRTAYLKIHAV